MALCDQWPTRGLSGIGSRIRFGPGVIPPEAECDFFARSIISNEQWRRAASTTFGRSDEANLSPPKHGALVATDQQARFLIDPDSEAAGMLPDCGRETRHSIALGEVLVHNRAPEKIKAFGHHRAFHPIGDHGARHDCRSG